jgi:VCBS repeat-containing protein
LGLEYADVTVPFALTSHTVVLSDVTTLAPVTATYLSGPDGVVSNPGEPVLPFATANVTVPGMVMRGVLFKGGTYEDMNDVLALTAAATTEVRGVHSTFISDVFFPIKLWYPNYYGVLTNPAQGATQLTVTPAHYKSTTSGSPLGTLRHFEDMDFRLYYSNYTDGIAADAAAPTIVTVTADPDGSGHLFFSATVIANPAAGVQEVWIAFMDKESTSPGRWDSIKLEQDPINTTLWTGALDLNGIPAENIQYFIQAVNGVGLVSIDTNQGAYYGVGMDTPAPNAEATTLTLESPPPSMGTYSSLATFSAVLSSNGTLLENRRIFFSLGSQVKQAMTDTDGRATVTMSLLGLPGDYEVQAFFAGTGQYLSSSDSADFTITKQPTSLELMFEPGEPGTMDTARLIATLKAGDRRLAEKNVIFVVTGSGGSLSKAVITNYVGEAILDDINLPAGTYNATASFSGMITLHTGLTLTFNDERYLPSTTSGMITLPNTPPQSADDAYSTDEDSTLIVPAPGVLMNDNDVNGDGLTAVLDTNPTHGTVTLNSDGSFNYMPDDDYNGSDSFTYHADDGTDEGNVATVTITINPTNDAPETVNDSYNVVTGNTLAVSAPGVLGNDTDLDGDALTAVLDSGPTNGALTLNSDGSFSYTPNSGFLGQDSFTYKANDGLLLSNVATVTITVQTDNTPPDCSAATSNITYIWPPDKNFVPVYINVTDADGDPITITIISIFQDEPVGRGSGSPDGMGIGTDTAYVRAERAGNGNGRVYHITFTAEDGQGGSCIEAMVLAVVDHDLSPDEINDIDGGPLYDSTQSS